MSGFRYFVFFNSDSANKQNTFPPCFLRPVLKPATKTEQLQPTPTHKSHKKRYQENGNQPKKDQWKKKNDAEIIHAANMEFFGRF